MRSSHLEEMPCICGCVLVVVARFLAAAVPRLNCDGACGCWPLGLPATSGSAVCVTVHTTIHGERVDPYIWTMWTWFIDRVLRGLSGFCPRSAGRIVTECYAC